MSIVLEVITDEQKQRLEELNRVFLEENTKLNLSALRTEELSWMGNVMDSVAVLESGLFAFSPQPPPLEEGEFFKTKVPKHLVQFAKQNRKNSTEAEDVLWQVLRDKNLGVKFRRQHPLKEGYILDFYCPEAKIGIELDGEIHDTQQHQKSDVQREEAIATEHHINIIRFGNDEILDDLASCIEEIQNSLQKSSPPLVEGLGEAKHTQQTKQILDIGTGGGFPLLPLAICLPNMQFTGLDATQKKIDAIQRIIDVMEIPNVDLLAGRTEELGRNEKYREQYDIVTARAVAPLNVLLEFASPFVKPGGKVLAWKSMNIEQELQESLMARAELSCQLIDSFKYDLSGDWGKRQVLVFEKRDRLDKKYPRETGTPKKNPLV